MENNQPKISVIVPIYNAQKYLHRCVDSILNQTFTDFEVLLINDGSTDQSPAICDEYAKRDSRVRVFHKENGGVSSARNVGLQNMKGEYSIHCDSDDWIEKDMFEGLIQTALSSKADMIICNYFHDNNNQKISYPQKPLSCNSLDIIRDILEGRLHGSTCNKLIRNELIIQHAISFNEQVNYCEDVLFIVQVLLKSKEITYLDKTYYHYCFNDQSITNKANLSQISRFPFYLDNLWFTVRDYPKLIDSYHLHVLRVKLIMINNKTYSIKKIKLLYEESNKYWIKLDVHWFKKLYLMFLFSPFYFFTFPLNIIVNIKKKYL